MKLWIRPVFKVEPCRTLVSMGRRAAEDVYEDSEREVNLSLALCTTNGAILVDEQIKEHFDKHDSGKDIEAAAREFYGATSVEWGSAINVTEGSHAACTQGSDS